MHLLNIHTHQACHLHEWQNLYPESAPIAGAFSVGIHPWYIAQNWQEQLIQVAQKALLPQCMAIGECGLDKFSSASLHTQQEVFLAHVALSERLQKPLIIHCVKAYSEIIKLRQTTNAQQLWIMHGFVKHEQLAFDLLKNGIKLSFGAALLHNVRLQELVKKLSPTDYFLETDDSPLPIAVIYEKLAQILANE